MPRLVIVGSGIGGLAHACAGLEAGYDVTVLERRGRPLGASVRNFGTLWPIGQPFGPRRELALRSRRRWQALARTAGFWFSDAGSLHLAYLSEGWSVLLEFVATAPDDAYLELLSPEEIGQRYPHVCRDGLRGGLFSGSEAAVCPKEAIASLIRWLEGAGVTFHFHTPVISVGEHRVRAGGGRPFAFDRLVICSGDEVDLLYPDELRAAGVQRCKLQMMRTAPLPYDWRTPPTVVADLTLRHYPSFAHCPSAEALRARVAAERPFYEEHGIHVIAAQKPDGSLVLGDSHAYGMAFEPGSRTDIDEAVLRYLHTFLDLPPFAIAERWTGTYLTSADGAACTRLRPAPDVDVLTGLGGAGMTLAFALAEETFAAEAPTAATPMGDGVHAARVGEQRAG